MKYFLVTFEIFHHVQIYSLQFYVMLQPQHNNSLAVVNKNSFFMILIKMRMKRAKSDIESCLLPCIYIHRKLIFIEFYSQMLARIYAQYMCRMNELNESMRCQFRYHNVSILFFAIQGVFEFYRKKICCYSCVVCLIEYLCVYFFLEIAIRYWFIWGMILKLSLLLSYD